VACTRDDVAAFKSSHFGTLCIMKSTAATVEQYLATLPEDRRTAISTVRRFILKHIDKRLEERMQYGVIAYCVPHSVWPHGHHTKPELPLMYMGLSSQKNDMVVYMLCLFENEVERTWFDKAWKATGRKNFLEVSGMGCCLRFKKLEELSLEVIGEALQRMPVKKYLEDHVAMLARRGKGPDGKTLKPSGGEVVAKKAARSSQKPHARSKAATPKKTRASSRAKQADERIVPIRAVTMGQHGA
jgi:hypothetical protein